MAEILKQLTLTQLEKLSSEQLYKYQDLFQQYLELSDVLPFVYTKLDTLIQEASENVDMADDEESCHKEYARFVYLLQEKAIKTTKNYASKNIVSLINLLTK